MKVSGVAKIGAALAMMLLVAACSGDTHEESAPPKGEGATPALATGKGDATDAVRREGPLVLGADGARAGEFTEDLEFHGYSLEVRPGAEVDLEITQRGSSRGLDTSLYVFGPQRADGSYGAASIAFDDDSGWGSLSRLKALRLEEGGSYLVVAGTFNGRGRGRYRLEARCLSGECAPLAPPAEVAACHPAIAEAITGCVADWQADPDFDSSVTSELELIAQCADAEPAAPAFDALCASAAAPAEVCGLSFEDFAQDYLPGCAHAIQGEALDRTCVFGARYRDLGRDADALVIVSRRVLTAADALTALEEAQLVEAVRRTAYDDVQTAAEAFEAVDQGEANQSVVWDASNRRAFVVYEVGAGDNSFGAWFPYGSAVAVADIQDGDIASCEVTWGAEHRTCTADAQCAEGLRCIGSSEASPLGRCVDLARDAEVARGGDCSAAASCDVEAGLVCSGASLGGSGLCEAAWQRGTFTSEPELAIPDNRAGGVEAQLLVYGLATVSTDVTIELLISHPRVADLRVTLINPSGTEATVFSGESDGRELHLRGVALRGFPGDESANGVWRLKVVDTRSGQVGTLNSFGLTVTSRWD